MPWFSRASSITPIRKSWYRHEAQQIYSRFYELLVFPTDLKKQNKVEDSRSLVCDVLASNITIGPQRGLLARCGRFS